MGNNKILRKCKKTVNLGFNTDIDAPLVIPLEKDLTLVKGVDRSLSVFDGEDDYIDLVNFTFKNQSKIFINAWFKTTDLTVLNKIYDESIASTNGSSRISLSIEPDGSVKFAGRGDDTDSFTTWVQTAASLIELNTVYNITANYDSTTNNHSIFINKVETTDTIATTTFDNTDPSADPKIGVRSNLTGQFMFGDIYECVFGIDNLTATEIGNIVDAGRNSFDWSTIDNSILNYDLTSASLGSDNVKDLSGNGNHGTSYGKGEFTRTTDGTVIDHNGNLNTVGSDIARFEGARFINDDKGFSTKVGENAIEFDKSNDEYVTTGLLVDDFDGADDSFSIILDIKKKAQIDNMAFYEADNGGGNRFYLVTDTGITDSLQLGLYSWNPTLSGVLELNKNYHCIVTYNGSTNTGYIYLDGVLQSSQSSITVDKPTTSLNIGGKTGSFLTGTVDNFILLNKYLTGEQVFQQYQFNKKGSTDVVAPDNVVLHLPLSDNSSTQTDISGNGNNGTFYSGGSPATPTLVEGVYDSDVSIPNSTLKGIMSYKDATNLFLNSDVPVTQSITIVNATVYTLSVIGTGSIEASVGGSGTATDGSDLTFTSTDTSVTLTVTGSLDRVMFNTGSFAMPYIKTEAAAVSTTADVAKDDVSSIITQGQGSLYCEFEYIGSNSNNAYVRVFSLHDGTNDNRITIYRRPSNYIAGEVRTGGVEQANIISSSGIMTVNTLHKVLITYKTNEVKFYMDGIKIGEDTTATIPTTLKQLNIGNSYNSIQQLNGNIKNVKYNKEVLSEAECIRRTSL